jgi:hypothetical protein
VSSTPRLTIFIATADRPQFLAGAVASLQVSARLAGLADTRILIVDDADSRSARPVAQSLGVSYAPNPVRDSRRNPSAARAWAVTQIDTELVALFDDDDIALPEHVAALRDGIDAGADVCATGYWLADPDPADPRRLVPVRRVHLRRARLGDLLLGYQPVNDQSMLRTEVARSVTWDPERENTMMYDVWLQLLLARRRFATTGTATFLYRQHPTSLSHTLDARDAELRDALLAERAREAAAVFGAIPGPSPEIRLRRFVERLRRP